MRQSSGLLSNLCVLWVIHSWNNLPLNPKLTSEFGLNQDLMAKDGLGGDRSSGYEYQIGRVEQLSGPSDVLRNLTQMMIAFAVTHTSYTLYSVYTIRNCLLLQHLQNTLFFKYIIAYSYNCYMADFVHRASIFNARIDLSF